MAAITPEFLKKSVPLHRCRKIKVIASIFLILGILITGFLLPIASAGATFDTSDTSGLIISNLTTTSGKNYVLDILNNGKPQYIDREYTFSGNNGSTSSSMYNVILEPPLFPGNPPITPRWAFEPWVWEDNTNNQTATINLVNGYTSRNIPVGAVIIDSPWETYFNTFQWDTLRYPNPQQMISDFHNRNIRVVLWITGFVNNDSPDYSYVKSNGYAVNF